MKKPCLLGILVLSTLAAAGQPSSLKGARVTGLKGQVQVKDSSVWRLLREGEQLAEATLLKLAEGSRLSLRYRADGHREEAQGPGQFTVGQPADTAGGAKVERFGFHYRPLQIPRSGGLDAVGGSVANANVHTMRPAAPITSSMASPYLPVEPVPFADGRGFQLRSELAEPPSVPMSLAWDATGPKLLNPQEGSMQVGESKIQAILFDGDAELAQMSVPRTQSLELSEYALAPDHLYRVEFVDEGVPKGSVTFRLLDAVEQQELLELTLSEATEPKDRLRKMDRFSELGEYHLAAEEGRRWLASADPEKDQEKVSAVLQVVHDVNRDILKDSRRVQYWQAWATSRKVPLIP